MKRSVILFFFLILASMINAQDGDIMKKDGMIYVVVAVMLTLLAGLVLYLVRLDRKISKLEKNK